MEVIDNDLLYRGAKLITGERVKDKRAIIDTLVRRLVSLDFEEIEVPILQKKTVLRKTITLNDLPQIYFLTDQFNNKLLLARDYISLMRNLAETRFRDYKNRKVFYVAKCFRNESSGYGFSKEFTVLGVHVLHSSYDRLLEMENLATDLIRCSQLPAKTYYMDMLDASMRTTEPHGFYAYTDFNSGLSAKHGFEIHTNVLKSASQLCTGGCNKRSFELTIGIDRLVLLKTAIDGGVFDMR